MTPRTSGRCPSRAIIKRVLIACVAVALMSDRCDANFFYNFIEEETDDILATLELTSLPATIEQVAGLTFTPAGEAIFGLGSTYNGTFDNMLAEAIVDDGRNGLTVAGCTFFGCVMYDRDPPPSTLVGDLEYFYVLFLFNQTGSIDVINAIADG